jgi:aspartyl aminopeptidase
MSRIPAGRAKYAQQFLTFVNSSPSPFHAVETAVQILRNAGFLELKESQVWDAKALELGKSYFFKRNQSALIAFSVGAQFEPGNGFAIVGAHTDSPCLKVKPISKREKLGYDQVGVETYGGGLW